jgi:hypothetical membrane protein
MSSIEAQRRAAQIFMTLATLAVLTAGTSIAISIALSPWFSFTESALSDLGNLTLNPATSGIFNAGLILSGLLVASASILAAHSWTNWANLSWLSPLGVAGLDLALVGFFPENTGRIHLWVSIVFFAVISITMLIYSYVSWPLGAPAIGALALAFGISSPIIWFAPWPWRGVAIQEAATSAMAAIWFILVSRQVLRSSGRRMETP